MPHGIAGLFRQLGTCRLLLEGNAAALFTAQMQSASVYLFRLPAIDDDAKVTSWAACWWDAIAGGYWDAARDIARLSPPTPNPQHEHEDDFLYVAFLMHEYFLATDRSDPTAFETHEREQSQRLARWRACWKGNPTPGLICARRFGAVTTTRFNKRWSPWGSNVGPLSKSGKPEKHWNQSSLYG